MAKSLIPPLPPGITLAPMTREDLPRLADLEKICFSTPWSQESLAAELQKENALFLAAHAEGQAVAYAGMNWVLDEGYVDNVAVHPSFRRQGLGRALMSALIQQARALDLAFLSLEVRPSNAGAIALYTSLGFREAGRRRNFYTQPAEDALILTLWFREPEVP